MITGTIICVYIYSVCVCVCGGQSTLLYANVPEIDVLVTQVQSRSFKYIYFWQRSITKVQILKTQCYNAMDSFKLLK